jgi:hypothetical protein
MARRGHPAVGLPQTVKWRGREYLTRDSDV